ncbi:MAG: sulfurtransferase TusA family protein [Limnochordales bacterium]|nr:sulfurtransferase TusA family protein [Limnochordales bacterium]
MGVSDARQVHRELDLKGEVCPYTFVKSKLVLETMAPGEILRVIVDYPPATSNVPRSMESEGHRVLSVGPAGQGAWEIVVRKKD